MLAAGLIPTCVIRQLLGLGLDLVSDEPHHRRRQLLLRRPRTARRCRRKHSCRANPRRFCSPRWMLTSSRSARGEGAALGDLPGVAGQRQHLLVLGRGQKFASWHPWANPERRCYAMGINYSFWPRAFLCQDVSKNLVFRHPAEEGFLARGGSASGPGSTPESPPTTSRPYPYSFLRCATT